ncbi:MAG: MFS transporter [Pseudomonadota bacterium]
MRPLPDMALAARSALGAMAPLVAPITAVSVLGLALSMSLPLFALVLEREGYSGTVIGLNSMAAPLAMVVSAPLMPRLLAMIGLVPLTLAATALLALTFALIPAVEGLLAWTVLRMAWGVASTALFFSGEFWVVAAAPSTSRGRAIAVYAIALSAAFMIGPIILLATGTEGALPFLVAAGISMAALPILAAGSTGAPNPEPEGQPKIGDTLRFFVSDPALLWAIVLFGVIEYGALSLMAVWGVRVGMTADTAAVLLALFAAGAIVLQLPLGWAADRFEPRGLLALCAATSVLCPLLLVAAAPSFAAGTGPMVLWGAFGAGLYTIALTALGNRYSGARLADANAAVTLAYGLGALTAPGLFGLAMDNVTPPHGLLYASSLAAVCYLGLTLWRMATRG